MGNDAIIAVNSEMLQFYWELGAEIVEKQKSSSWGDRLLPQLSRDLSAEFPEMKGFSVSNLKYMRQWFLFYTGGHNVAIIAKCKNLDEALYYVQNTIVCGWRRSEPLMSNSDEKATSQRLVCCCARIETSWWSSMP